VAEDLSEADAMNDGIGLFSTAHPQTAKLTPWARVKLWWRWNTPWGGLPTEKVEITVPDDDPGLRGVPLRPRAVNHDGPAR